MRSEREKEEEKGTPIIVANVAPFRLCRRGDRSRNLPKPTDHRDQRQQLEDVAKAMPSEGVENCELEVVKMMIEQLGYRRVILRSVDEPAIVALKEALR